MDPELKQLLEENIKLSKENNEILNSLIRTNKRKKIIQYIYWGLIILVTFGSLFFIQPLIGSLTSLYTGGASDLLNQDSVKSNVGNSSQQVQDLLNKLNVK